jgi:ribosome biogenesis GTPase
MVIPTVELPEHERERALTRLGWSPFFQESIPHTEGAGNEVARVVAPHRSAFEVLSPAGELLASLTGRLLRAIERGEEERPAVGDWVVIDPRSTEGTATVQAVLPRRTKLSRKAAGRTAAEQVLAANVDVAFLVSALTRDLSIRRLERYLALVREGGVNPVVVLTKSDLCEEAAEARAEVERAAGGAPVHAVSSLTGDGVAELDGYFKGNQTVVLLGSSGVGKSTLINRWIGRDTQAVHGLREDGKGRHTTTHRELFVVPSGGLVIDTPGMRELGLWEAGEGVKDVFTDMEELAQACRFRDCEHSGEPGCAVEQAQREGRIEKGRMEAFQKLRLEVAHLERQRDERARVEAKRHAKTLSRAVKAAVRRKGR